MAHALRRLFGAVERKVWLGLSGDSSKFLAADGSEGTPAGSSSYISFPEAIDDPINDNFQEGNGAGGMDSGGTRSNPVGGTPWTAENSPTTAVANGRLVLTSPASASVQIRGHYMDPGYLDSENWCIRMHIAVRPTIDVGGQRAGGLYLRDSSSGKLELWGLSYDSGGPPMVWAAKMTNATTFSATRGFTAHGTYIHPAFIEIEYDGTNYYLRMGYADGPLYRYTSFAKTNFLSAAADQIGVFSANWENDETDLISRGIYRVPTSRIV